ncbi:alpha/beta-hydrolase [Calocera cornea HHB12733]|uniref:Alpha/beta-hydrolase n=1 Tax=Calocera cornea HHB12733 TaxID=1353952 RepID=A0A165H0E1_9BASI|nr:alpha/beta-hydrolase [Calocera cornea HHB12733]
MEPTWSTAELGVLVPGDPPIHLQYFDTSPKPPSGAYTTLILVHGTGFNSRIWYPCLPHLPPSMRVLAFNRRGYTGSSPAHESSDPQPMDVEAFGRYVLDLLGFMRYAVDVLRVPPTPREGEVNKGGIVLLGWSKGCATIISLLSYLTSAFPSTSHPLPLPTPLAPYLPLLSSHLRSAILFEPPQMIFGLPGPAEYPELKGVPPGRLPEAFAQLLLGTIPEGKRAIVLQVEDEGGNRDIVTWHGRTAEERRAVCEIAFLADVRVGTLYCAGTTFEPVVNGTKWVNAQYAAAGLDAAPRFAKGVVAGGNHFGMATDPEAFGRALGEVLAQLEVE